jgi:hypothetical protein
MRGTHYTKETKTLADRLRSQGKTYQEIKALLGIPKSTLSTWFSEKHANLYSKEIQRAHLAKIRLIARTAVFQRIEKRNKETNEKAGGILKKIPQNVMIDKLALSLLYWAEGSKHSSVSGLIFVNTDPVMMEMYVRLLRRAYSVDETRFRVRIHLHYYHEKKDLTKFWSELLNIPESQFASPYLKPRSKKKRFRRNSKGICLLRYGDSNIRRELLEISRLFAERVIMPSSFNG